MVHGTAVVWLPVTDVPRSLAFYRDTLSLEEVNSGEDWAELDANGLQLRDAGVEIAGEISEHPL